ncbi:hypothetical protein ABZP36_000636 [Zizania latifolia]
MGLIDSGGGDSGRNGLGWTAEIKYGSDEVNVFNKVYAAILVSTSTTAIANPLGFRRVSGSHAAISAAAAATRSHTATEGPSLHTIDTDDDPTQPPKLNTTGKQQFAPVPAET